MGDLPVPCLPAAIFWTCGYPNQLHFSRAFKKRYGCLPGSGETRTRAGH